MRTTVVLLVFVLLTSCGERLTDAPIAVVDPEFLVLRPVSRVQEPSATLTGTVDGQTYYFSAEKLLDTTHFDLRTAKTDALDPNEPARRVILLNTTPAGARVLGQWSESNIGKQIGVFLDGKLVMAPIVQSRVDSAIMIDGDFNPQMVDALVARLRRGGAR